MHVPEQWPVEDQESGLRSPLLVCTAAAARTKRTWERWMTPRTSPRESRWCRGR